MTTKLGTEIRRLRHKAGKTLRSFAKEIGVSAAHQSDIERGHRLPSDEVLRRIAKALAPAGARYDDLKKLDTRLEADLEQWVQKHHEARQMLREVKSSGRPVDDVLEELQQLLRDEQEEEEDEG